MKKYKILCNSDMTKLIRSVNNYLEKGWQCQGGLVVINSGFYDDYYQAIVR